MLKNEIVKDINALIRHIREKTIYNEKFELIEYLKKGNPGFCSEACFCDIIIKIVAKDVDFKKYVAIAKEIFEIVCYNETNLEELQVFNRLFALAFDNQAFIEKIGISTLYSLFEDKRVFLDIIRNLESHEYTDRNLSYVLLYIKKARQIWVDENAGYSSIMDTLTRLQPHGDYSDEELAAFIAKEIEIDYHEAGNVDYKSSDIRDLTRQAGTIEEGLKKQVSESMNLKIRLDKLKDEILAEYDMNIEKIRKDIAGNTARVAEELMKFRRQIEAFDADISEKVTKYQNQLKAEVDWHLRTIDDKGLEHYNLIVNLLELHPEVKDEAKVLTGATNKTLDMSVPLKTRLDEFYKLKNPNELYHEKFDKIAKDVIASKVIWVVGPTGCGKSFIFKQIARLIGVPMYNLGFVTDETMDIKGFVDAQGVFHTTQFYDAYKFGGICFFDEIDNSKSRALIELNKIMGSGGFETYTFPNKEKVAPHPNFRLVAAGNTWGDGADPKYPDRIKVDKAIRNRFTQESYGYDPNLEMRILHKYPAAYDFLKAFRDSVDKRGISIVVTTRDMAEFRDSLDQECYSPDEIITGRLIQNNKIEILTAVLGDMKTLPEDNPFLAAFKQCLKKMSNAKTA